MRYYWPLFCPVFLACSLSAWSQEPFRANIKGNGNTDRGKCTIEVRVDGVAEVEFAGDTGRMRTLSGQPSQWTRIDCSGPMPRNMRDFKFTGIDGRGRMTLVADPRNSDGVAVVRVEDPKSGSEGYTYDLEWQGGTDYTTGGGYRRDRDRDSYGDPRGRGYTVNCSSDDGRRRYCDVNTSDGVRLVRQHGEACRQGETWGYDSRGIWVDRGCRGEFQVGVR